MGVGGGWGGGSVCVSEVGVVVFVRVGVWLGVALGGWVGEQC